MNIESLEQKLVAVVVDLVPLAHIEFSTEDDHMDLIVHVYSVPMEMVKRVKVAIHGASIDFPDLCITPMVRTLEVTRKYYPQFLRVPAWSKVSTIIPCGEVSDDGCVIAYDSAIWANMFAFEDADATLKAWLQSHALVMHLGIQAANEELALAA
jgi:hypothetical protein